MPLLLGLGCACAGLERALAPAPRPWPIPADGRARLDGRILRVHGGSLKSRADADKDARRNLERWLWSLDIDRELPERRALIREILDSPQAVPVPSPVLRPQGHYSVISLDLLALQERLGTHYDAP